MTFMTNTNLQKSINSISVTSGKFTGTYSKTPQVLTYADSSQIACHRHHLHRRRRPRPPLPPLLHAATWRCEIYGSGAWCPARCLAPPHPPPHLPVRKKSNRQKKIQSPDRHEKHLKQKWVKRCRERMKGFTFSSMMSISEYFIPFTKIGISLFF